MAKQANKIAGQSDTKMPATKESENKMVIGGKFKELTKGKAKEVAKKLGINLDEKTPAEKRAEREQKAKSTESVKEAIKGAKARADKLDKPKAKPKAIVPFEGKKTIEKDNNITEIVGCPEHATFVDTDKVSGGKVSVVDRDGGKHSIEMVNRSDLWFLLARYGKDYSPKKSIDAFVKQNELAQKQTTSKLFKTDNTPLLWRVQPDKKLFAFVTHRWTKVDAIDLEPIVKDSLGKDAKVITKPSNGEHGGYVTATLGKIGNLAEPAVRINAGCLDGHHGIDISARISILACSNQLTMAVREQLSPILPKFSLYSREIHSGKIAELGAVISEIADNVRKNITTLIDKAIAERLTPKQIESVLKYYIGQGIISARTAREVIIENGNPKISQKPSTVYGLAMALSYEGTHESYKDGVKHNLQKTAGELLVVAPQWNGFMRLIGEHQPKKMIDLSLDAKDKK